MDSHKNARLTVRSRELLAIKVVRQGVTLKLAAASFSVTEKTAGKWVRRYREQGVAGLADRSSRPHRLYRPTASDQIERVEQLRRQRWTGYRIARTTGLSRSTVSRILAGCTSTASATWSRHRPSSATNMPLRRPAASRHQEAGPHRQALAPRHRRPPRPRQARRLGVRARRHRRSLAHRDLGHLP